MRMGNRNTMKKPIRISLLAGLVLFSLGFLVIVGGVAWGLIQTFSAICANFDPSSPSMDMKQLHSGILKTLISLLLGIPILTVGLVTAIISFLVHIATQAQIPAAKRAAN